MNREELIEKAAVMILARSWGLGTMESARADAKIALAVFEQAHITDALNQRREELG